MLLKEAIQWERFFEVAPSTVTRGHRCKLFKKRKGILGQKFFSARVVELWNELDDRNYGMSWMIALFQ